MEVSAPVPDHPLEIPSTLTNLGYGAEAIDRFILRALERDPASRYQSAQEMVTALRALVSDVPAPTELDQEAPTGELDGPRSFDLPSLNEEHRETPVGEEATVIEALDYELKIGAQVGEYQITGVLGVGGMGEVYAGIQPLIGKKVAIKVLQAALSSDRTMAARFIQEARSVNEIGHRNIIDVFSFGELPNGRQYFVMEYLPGESLGKRLDRALPLSEGIPILIEVCDGLAAVHASGIIHRDLKPDNIYIAQSKTGDKMVKVLDFGIAKLMDPGADVGKTKAGHLVGTPLYMAPEQCLDLPTDARTDIYAFGVVLYQVVTGRLPFSKGPALEVMNAHVKDPPRRPSELLLLPSGLEALILRCLEKAPEYRPKTIQVVREELRRILADMGAETLSSERRTKAYLDPAATKSLVGRARNAAAHRARIVEGFRPHATATKRFSANSEGGAHAGGGGVSAEESASECAEAHPDRAPDQSAPREFTASVR